MNEFNKKQNTKQKRNKNKKEKTKIYRVSHYMQNSNKKEPNFLDSLKQNCYYSCRGIKKVSNDEVYF